MYGRGVKKKLERKLGLEKGTERKPHISIYDALWPDLDEDGADGSWESELHSEAALPSGTGAGRSFIPGLRPSTSSCSGPVSSLKAA